VDTFNKLAFYKTVIYQIKMIKYNYGFSEFMEVVEHEKLIM